MVQGSGMAWFESGNGLFIIGTPNIIRRQRLKKTSLMMKVYVEEMPMPRIRGTHEDEKWGARDRFCD